MDEINYIKVNRHLYYVLEILLVVLVYPLCQDPYLAQFFASFMFISSALYITYQEFEVVFKQFWKYVHSK